jgi:hypothetical protein
LLYVDEMLKFLIKDVFVSICNRNLYHNFLFAYVILVKMLGLLVGHTSSYEFLLVPKDNSFMLVFIHEKLRKYFEVLFLSSVIHSQILNP